MFVQRAVDVGEDALGGGFARDQVVIAVRKDFRLHDRHQTSRLTDRSVSEGTAGEARRKKLQIIGCDVPEKNESLAKKEEKVTDHRLCRNGK